MKVSFKIYKLIVLSSLIALNGFANGGDKQPAAVVIPAKKDQTKTADQEIVQTAKAAYIYGLPIVLTDFTRLAGGAHNNVFAHGHKFPDHTSRLVVAPNNDTNYSSAFLDLGDDAVVLTIPDTKDRYFVVPLMDAWTNVFASFGKRTTGTHAQTYVITGPHWKGTIPDGLKEVKSPTDLVWIIGRIQVNSPDDQVNFVSKIQDQFKLTLLSDWGKGTSTPPKITTYNTDLPTLKQVQSHELTVVKGVKQLPAENFFNYLNELLVKNPGLPADSAVLKSFAKIGIKPGGKFDLSSFDAETQAALKNVPANIYSAFDGQTRREIDDVKPKDGAKIGDYKTDYLLRAVVAYKGLGALAPEEATYIGYNEDGNKNPLDGNNKYVIHFEKGKLPPAGAFWSLTLYDKDRYLTANTIRRYAIGDRNPLKFNKDGSLDIYIQHDDPGADKQSNWLPAPLEAFNVTLRIYVPAQSYLADKKTWVNPPINKLN